MSARLTKANKASKTATIYFILNRTSVLGSLRIWVSQLVAKRNCKRLKIRKLTDGLFKSSLALYTYYV